MLTVVPDAGREVQVIGSAGIQEIGVGEVKLGGRNLNSRLPGSRRGGRLFDGQMSGIEWSSCHERGRENKR
jgi:hypothetical protein